MTIQLTPKEVSAIQMALQQVIEDNEEIAKDSTLPFTPEARCLMRDFLKTLKSAREKIVGISGHEVKMEPYNEGDEKEFLTKES